jgi:hypothetical protein
MARGSKALSALWVVAALAQLAGDVSLYLASRNVRSTFARFDVRLTSPMPDSLRHAASRYLRDSLGVTPQREGDTLVVRLPPDAQRALDATVSGLRQSSRSVITWLVLALVLLHVPLALAIVATLQSLANAEGRRRNRGLGAPWEE